MYEYTYIFLNITCSVLIIYLYVCFQDSLFGTGTSSLGKTTTSIPNFPQLLVVIFVGLKFYGLFPSTLACPLALSLLSPLLAIQVHETLWV